jgi:hypothetical protein
VTGIICMGYLQYELLTGQFFDYWILHPTVFPIKYKEVQIYLKIMVPIMELAGLLRIIFFAPTVTQYWNQLFKSLDLFFNDPHYYYSITDKPWKRGYFKNPSLSCNGNSDGNGLTWEDKIQICRQDKGLATVREEDSEYNGTILDPKHQTKAFHLLDSVSSRDGSKINHLHSTNPEKRYSLIHDRYDPNSLEAPKPKLILDNYARFASIQNSD